MLRTWRRFFKSFHVLKFTILGAEYGRKWLKVGSCMLNLSASVKPSWGQRLTPRSLMRSLPHTPHVDTGSHRPQTYGNVFGWTLGLSQWRCGLQSSHLHYRALEGVPSHTANHIFVPHFTFFFSITVWMYKGNVWSPFTSQTIEITSVNVSVENLFFFYYRNQKGFKYE